MPTFYGAIDLAKNELRNAVVQNLGSAPSSPVQGQLWFDSTGKNLYWHNGTTWVLATGSGAGTPATTVTTQAVGDAPVVGTSTNYAREDHKHGREAFGVVTAEATFGASSSNGAATTLARSDHAHGNPAHDNAAHSAIALSALGVPTASVNLNSQKIINLATPTAGTDAANKSYVDNLTAGLSWKQAVRVASTAQSTATGLIAVDGVTVSAGDRVLLKNQAAPETNGIYIAAAGAWARATDADTAAELNGMAVFVMEGTTNQDTAWVNTATIVTLNSDPVTYAQFAGGGAITAGAGMTQVGNTLNVIAGDTSLTVAADSIVVNTAVIATVASLASYSKKYAGALTGTASPETVTHNLNTRDIQLTVLNGSSPYTAVEVDWDATTVNTAVVRYNPNLGAGYRVVVVG